MLPRLSGFDVLRELRRRRSETPVIMLTARGQIVDKVAGLKLGQTTTSPSRSRWPSFLRASRRSCARAARAATGGGTPVWRCPDRLPTREVTRDGRSGTLSAREFQLLRY